MDEQDRIQASLSREISSLSPLQRSCQEEENSTRWQPTPHHSAGTAANAGSVEEPTELPSRPQTREQNAETPLVDLGVRRSQRRGLFARYFLLVPERNDPYQYDNTTKWFIVFVVAYCAAAAPMGSAIIFPSLSQAAAQLHTTSTLTNLTVTLYMLSMAFTPIWWTSFSEIFGRRNILLISFVLFIVFAILSALSTSITVLLVLRVLCGGAAASIQAVGAITVADIWLPRERGKAMTTFQLGPLLGPAVGPVLGGTITGRWGWRATQYFLAIFGGTTFLLVFFCLPETLRQTRNVIEASREQEAEQQSQGSPNSRSSRTSTLESLHRRGVKRVRLLRVFIVDPLEVIQYLRFPAVFLIVYYASVTFGSLYVLNISIQATFEQPPYSFRTMTIGLLYLPASLGYVLSSVSCGTWMDRIMAREARQAGRFDEHGQPICCPEDRMRENAWLGAVMYPIALIVYGWTVEKGIHWAVPMAALFFFGAGSMILLSLATTMLSEFMPGRSASGMALNNLGRSIFSAIGSIVAASTVFAIGNGWLFTILGLLTLASASVVWSMKHYGSRWRVAMDKTRR